MSKSMQKRLAVQRPPRYVQGFADGTGLAHVRDMAAPAAVVGLVEGRTVAVTSWGCSCCQGEETQEQRDMAAKIVKALNVLDAVERLTVLRPIGGDDGAVSIGPEGWAQVQNALGS